MVFTRLNIDALKTQVAKDKSLNVSHSRTSSSVVQKTPDQFLDPRTRAEQKAEQVAERRRRQDNIPQKEFGGPKGLEPTRYGDWEKAGRCFDF